MAKTTKRVTRDSAADELASAALAHVKRLTGALGVPLTQEHVETLRLLEETAHKLSRVDTAARSSDQELRRVARRLGLACGPTASGNEIG